VSDTGFMLADFSRV